jgi:hypothetical protein
LTVLTSEKYRSPAICAVDAIPITEGVCNEKNRRAQIDSFEMEKKYKQAMMVRNMVRLLRKKKL